MYNIKQSDLSLLYQHQLSYAIKVEVLQDDLVIDVLYGITDGGSLSIDSESDVRRTFNITIIPTLKNDINVNEKSLIWLNKEARLYIGLKNVRTGEYTWYNNGCFIFAECSGQFDVTTNQLSINCNDKMALLDGTKNGQIGALTTLIPAYEEDPDTGEPLNYTIIRNAIISTIDQLGRIKNYIIDDVGEYKGQEAYNPNWETYREQNPLWNTVPYDLEFDCGCTVLSILQELRDLYPNYEMFFDESGIFHVQMIPSCYDDDIIFPNAFLQRILISESTSVDLTAVRNICEVWGQVIDADFYTEDCTYSSNCYSCTVEAYEEEYKNGDLVAVEIPAVNSSSPSININGFGEIPIYDENTDAALAANKLEENVVFVFKIKKQRVDGEYQTKAYLLGHWQAHGMNVLTDGTTGDSYTSTNGVTADRYSKEYFQTVYNCESVEFTTIPNSPFTVQKIGEILDVKTGGEYENITSDSLALSRAEYENWKNCRLTDSITLTTLLVPFYDVNIKVSYQRSDSDVEEQYIIKSVSHDFSGGQSTITLMKFYPLYAEVA